MRVLIVADVIGGVRTFARELVAGLAQREVEVHLALLGPDRHAVREFPAAATCQVRDWRLEWMADPWADVARTRAWVAELIHQHRPDLVHMNTFTSVEPPFVPVLLSAHSCVLTWWRGVRGRQPPPGWDRYARLVRAALDRANVLVTPTRALQDTLREEYGDLPAVRVIPNGRRVPTRPAGSRRRLVVSVGRLWDEAKNAELLVRAAPQIDARLLLIGPGAASGMESLGPQPESEVLRRLSSASVFVEAARYEPFGLAALEGALCGCALVLGDIPSLREVWGPAASFVSPDDPDQLAHTVNGLLDDPARSIAAARARAVASRLSPEAMAAAYLDTYAQLRSVAVVP